MQKPDQSVPAEKGQVEQCAIPETSSVSLEHDNGTDKETSVQVNQILLKVGFAL